MASLLAGLLRERGWSQRLALHRSFLVWDRVVGRTIARHAQPAVIRGTVLWLAVSDPIWMQQLQLEKPRILERLNSELAGAKLTDLRFRLSPLPELEPAPPAPRSRRPRPEKLPAVVQEALAGVTDEELKGVLAGIWYRSGGGVGAPEVTGSDAAAPGDTGTQGPVPETGRSGRQEGPALSRAGRRTAPGRGG
ncbi:MAG: DUF721 domain-containing protein [Thermodesulfobacteriota bacterium]